MMARQSSMEPLAGSQETRPSVLQSCRPVPIDKDRLIWDPEYRAEVTRQLKAAARAT